MKHISVHTVNERFRKNLFLRSIIKWLFHNIHMIFMEGVDISWVGKLVLVYPLSFMCPQSDQINWSLDTFKAWEKNSGKFIYITGDLWSIGEISLGMCGDEMRGILKNTIHVIWHVCVKNCFFAKFGKTFIIFSAK